MIVTRSKNIFLSQLKVAEKNVFHLPSNFFDLTNNEFARITLVKIKFSDTSLGAMYLRSNFGLTNFENIQDDARVHHSNVLAEVTGAGFEDHTSVFGSSIGNRVLDRIELQLTNLNGAQLVGYAGLSFDAVLRWEVVVPR